MGKIYELFGQQEGSVVDKLPNEKLKKSIVSGNYGYLKRRRLTVDKDNAGYKYLMNEQSEYNIEYWYNAVIDGKYNWTEMAHKIRKWTTREYLGLHPGNYGVKSGELGASCRCFNMAYFDRKDVGQRLTCQECHKKAIMYLYCLYLKQNKKIKK